MKRSPLLVALLVFLLAACSSPDSASEARTYYESLDLSSPEATVETFVEAFNTEDFMTVWLALDWRAQREIKMSFDLLQLSKLVDTAEIPEPGRTITDPIADLVGRGNLDRWRIFDELMLVAASHDAFLIDIGELESMRRVTTAESGQASVAVLFAGASSELTFNLTKGESDRWFVNQVVTPGGDTEQIPWAVP